MYINEDKILKKDKKLRLSLAQKFKRWGEEKETETSSYGGAFSFLLMTTQERRKWRG
jgi:hypothetical protein